MASKGGDFPAWLSGLLGAAALVGIVFGLQAAKGLLVPLLLASFLALVCTGPVRWLERHRVPVPLAVGITVLGLVAPVGLVGGVVGASIGEFTSRLPRYQVNLRESLRALEEELTARGVPVSASEVLAAIDPGATLGLARDLLTTVTGVFGNSFLILFTLIFMLAEACYFPQKLELAFPQAEATLARLERFHRDMNRYLALKSLVSLLTGLTVWIFLAVVGVDFALIWGLVAFLLNYIPNIGSFIAAIPAVLVTYLQLGVGSALLVVTGYAVINVVLGNGLEPRVMGEGMGLSTFVVVLSLVFWGWVLGPAGMLLAVPLTMALRFALESAETTRPLAILLASTSRVRELPARLPKTVGPPPEEETTSELKERPEEKLV